MKKRINKICQICKKEFKVIPFRKDSARTCSRKCHHIYQSIRPQIIGEKHHCWKGGEYKNKRGYVTICKNFYNKENMSVYKHRIVMEKHLKRHLTPEEVVHHRGIEHPINSIENKQDNRIKNLQLFKNASEHQKYHKSLE